MIKPILHWLRALDSFLVVTTCLWIIFKHQSSMSQLSLETLLAHTSQDCAQGQVQQGGHHEGHHTPSSGSLPRARLHNCLHPLRLLPDQPAQSLHLPPPLSQLAPPLLLLVHFLFQLLHSLLKPSQKHRPGSSLPSPANPRYGLNLRQAEPVKDQVEQFWGKAAPTQPILNLTLHLDLLQQSAMLIQHVCLGFLCLIQNQASRRE